MWYHPVVHFTFIIPNDKSLFKVIGNTSYIIYYQACNRCFISIFNKQTLHRIYRLKPTTLEVILDAEVFGWKNSYENPSRDLPQPPHGWRPIHRENIIIVPNTNHVSTRPTSANRWHLKAHLRFFVKNVCINLILEVFCQSDIQ